MAFPRINLQEKLETLRNREISQGEILEQVREILNARDREKEILLRLNETDPAVENAFDPELLETSRIFHISQIKKICATYRLRFLSTGYFRGELPAAALHEIKRLEELHDTELRGFSIMAPAKLFMLENADDPVLFAPVGNDYHYLVHKWGKDLHPLRRLLMWPLKDLENLLIFSIFLSFVLTFGIRELFFWGYRETSQFIMLFMFAFKSLVGLILFYGIALGKNFSEANWRSQYYNG